MKWLTDSNGNRCSVEYFGSQEKAQAALDPRPICTVDVEKWRVVGCDSNKFYIIHPEDVLWGCGDTACEHEILTD